MRQVLIPRDLPAAIPLHAIRQITVLQGATMGTTWSVKYTGTLAVEEAFVRQTIETILHRIVQQMSTWKDDSDICIFNRAEAGSWHKLPRDFTTVLRCALTLAAESGGAYDPTIGALVSIWGFGAGGRKHAAPSPQEISAAKASSGWSRLAVTDHSTFLQPGGFAIDLSSIAKGYAVDCVADALERLGLLHYLVEIGGELRGSGIKPDGQPWWIALERPPSAETDFLPETVVALFGLSAATSGDSMRWFESDGRRFSHTLDPRNGYPADSRVATVTVLHRKCMHADALATALAVLGADDGPQFALQQNLAARFVLRGDNGLTEHLSPALTAMLA